MHVGVLGGGLQGCCVALALANRGVRVSIFDKNEDLLSKAAIANEGKIHLGYMYASDTTFATAKTMVRGALEFSPFFSRHLGQSAESFAVSSPATYIVHRDSQRNAGDVSEYLRAVHKLVNQAAEGKKDGAYFGKDLKAPLRFWSSAETEREFDARSVLTAASTPEIAINPTALAANVRKSIADHPRIDHHRSRVVTGATVERNGISVVSEGEEGRSTDRFDCAVNALWDGRFALNEALGFRPNRPWLHRLKYGVSFRLPAELRAPPSVTIVLGPFGEVVPYADGTIYLTWYPECLRAISTDIAPPDWETYPSEPLRSQIIDGTFRALSEIVTALRPLQPATLPEAVVKGGVIVAWGETDIYDPDSELHRRFEIGVTSEGCFHSIDPGKLTMAPYFAEICADRIKPQD